MNDILNEILLIIDGKGGGSNIMAQGSGSGVEDVKKALNISYQKVKKELLK